MVQREFCVKHTCHVGLGVLQLVGFPTPRTNREISVGRESLRAVFPSLNVTPFPSGIERRRNPRSRISSTIFIVRWCARSGDHVK